MKKLLLTFVVFCGMVPTDSAVAEKIVPYADKRPVRDGFVIGAALGPSALLGLGIENASATGGSFSFRMGTSAGPRLLFLVQLDGAGYLFKDMSDQVATNQYLTADLAAQFYLSNTAWIKGLVGLANFRQEIRSGVKLPKPEENFGINAGGSIGLDVYRHKRFALDIELSTYAGVVKDGGILQGRLALGAHFY